MTENVTALLAAGKGIDGEFNEARDKLPVSFFETVCAFLNPDRRTILPAVRDDGPGHGWGLTNLIKMLAYQSESDLLALLEPHYHRCDHEGRTLLHELFAARADLRVTTTELLVKIHPLSSPHRTQAVAALCKELNDTATPFPGSNLRLQFEVAPSTPACLAFPGPRPLRVLTEPDPPDIE